MSKRQREEVVDASYILSLLLPDEKSHDDIPDKMIAPALLKNEVTNALRSAVVSKRINTMLARQLIEEFLSWSIKYLEVDVIEVFDMAIENKLSVYDTNYLWIAKKHKVGMRTFDKQLLSLSA